jgi:uncharacterized repeat protein (TIGR01451 family)
VTFFPNVGFTENPTPITYSVADRTGLRSNAATITITYVEADLAILKSVSDSKPNNGDTITYTVKVANTGPDTATGVFVTDVLPGGLTFDSSSART